MTPTATLSVLFSDPKVTKLCKSVKWAQTRYDNAETDDRFEYWDEQYTTARERLFQQVNYLFYKRQPKPAYMGFPMCAIMREYSTRNPNPRRSVYG